MGRILITGAAGLVGRAVVRQLVARGRQVLAVDRHATKVAEIAVKAVDLTDANSLQALPLGQNLSGIIHCGAISGPMLGRDNPFAIVMTNVVGTANVLEVARIHGIRRFISCSSASAYGPSGGAPINDATPLRPSTVYGASKVAGEQLVAAYAKEHGLEGASLRLAWVYGPERKTSCVLRQMLIAALSGEALNLPFGAGYPRQYVHAEDAAAALILALDAPHLGQSEYAVTGGRIDTLDQVADLVRAIVPTADIILAEGPDPLDDHQGPIDMSATIRDLKYRPAVGLAEGIADFARRLSPQPGCLCPVGAPNA